MQQPMSANPVQVVVMAHPGIIDKHIKYRNMKASLARQLVGLGIAQLLIGFLCIIFQGIAVGIFVNQSLGQYILSLDFIGHGIWCGIMVSDTLMSSICRSHSTDTPIIDAKWAAYQWRSY